MKKYIYFLLTVFCFIMLSCGNNDTTIDEPDSTETTKYPEELVGTWCYYSGTPSSLFVDFNEEDILNMTYILTSNGNLSETFVYYKSYYEGESTSTIGNWYVENNKIIILDWNGNKINGDLSYRINSDNSMTLTLNGHSAVFYKQEDIVNFYPNLIVGKWNNNRSDAGRIRYSFYSDGKAQHESTYINGFFYGCSSFLWSCNGKELTIQEEGIEQIKYQINYVNERSLSWNTSYLIRE